MTTLSERVVEHRVKLVAKRERDDVEPKVIRFTVKIVKDSPTGLDAATTNHIEQITGHSVADIAKAASEN
jgi:hypothetical protein